MITYWANGLILWQKIEYVSYATVILVMNSIMFLNVHLYLLWEICIYPVIVQIDKVQLVFITYFLKTNN